MRMTTGYWQLFVETGLKDLFRCFVPGDWFGFTFQMYLTLRKIVMPDVGVSSCFILPLG